MIRKLFNWIFKKDLDKLKSEILKVEIVKKKLEKQYEEFNNVLSGIDVSVDVHEYNYSPSWAVISFQGEKSDFIKFINLGKSDIMEISRFLRKFDRKYNMKVDASPMTSHFLKVERFESF